tara:strand:- start:1505 stop:2926 length:1422 start_codon:yes stop_codon:yes gene_type:complete
VYDRIDIEEIVEKEEKKSKLISLLISCCTVGLIMLLLAFITLTVFKQEQIDLVVAATQGEKELKINKNTFTTSVRNNKPSRPDSKPADVIVSTNVSKVSLPSIDNLSPTIGTSFNDGFGAGGFGTGIGGGFRVPTTMGGRCGTSDRINRLIKAGGKRQMDTQVLNALRWIKTQQKPDGSFGTKFPIAMTSFALLAYSGHCETVDSPEFGKSVKAAIEYLLAVSEKGKGYITTSRDRNLSYEHGIAMYALAEAYSMNKNARARFKRISPALKIGIPIVIEGQTNGGGWLYSYGSNGTGDLSVSGWNIQALKAAELTGLKFTGLDRAKQKAVRYLRSAEDPNGTDGYFRYRVSDGQKGKLSLTGVGAYSARMLGAPSKLEDKSLNLIISKNPKNFNPDKAYSWYYHSLAAFQKQGKHWRDYNSTYQQVMANTQEKNGSWPASAGHGQVGQDGKLYSTCLCTLMLEVYYRYLPTSL